MGCRIYLFRPILRKPFIQHTLLACCSRWFSVFVPGTLSYIYFYLDHQSVPAQFCTDDRTKNHRTETGCFADIIVGWNKSDIIKVKTPYTGSVKTTAVVPGNVFTCVLARKGDTGQQMGSTLVCMVCTRRNINYITTRIILLLCCSPIHQ